MKHLRKFNEDLSTNELEKGIEVESEHGNIYEQIDSYLESFNVGMPWSKKEFYKKIAEAHLKEIPDYYTRLEKMERE